MRILGVLGKKRSGMSSRCCTVLLANESFYCDHVGIRGKRAVRKFAMVVFYQTNRVVVSPNAVSRARRVEPPDLSGQRGLAVFGQGQTRRS